MFTYRDCNMVFNKNIIIIMWSWYNNVNNVNKWM